MGSRCLEAWRCGSIYSGGDHLGGQYPSHNNDGATHDRDENEKRHSSDDELHSLHNKPPVCATNPESAPKSDAGRGLLAPAGAVPYEGIFPKQPWQIRHTLSLNTSLLRRSKTTSLDTEATRAK